MSHNDDIEEMMQKRAVARLDALELATHRHYKGGLYRFICEGKHTEEGYAMVAYEHLWPYAPSFHHRPSDLFYGKNEQGERRFYELVRVSVEVNPEESMGVSLVTAIWDKFKTSAELPNFLYRELAKYGRGEFFAGYTADSSAKQLMYTEFAGKDAFILNFRPHGEMRYRTVGCLKTNDLELAQEIAKVMSEIAK